jgi:hypothetical protein
MTHDTVLAFLKNKNYPHPEHAIEVRQIIEDSGINDPIVLLAASLHDVKDVTTTTNQEITERFGSLVADITEELYLDLKNPSSNFMIGALERAEHLSPQASTILLADFIASMKIEHFKPGRCHFNRNVIAWVRDVTRKIPNPPLALHQKLDEALQTICTHFQYPIDESQKEVWQEMTIIIEGHIRPPV